MAHRSAVRVSLEACTCTSFGQCPWCADERAALYRVEWVDEPDTETATASWTQLDFFDGGAGP